MDLFFQLNNIFRKISLNFCDSPEKIILESHELSQIKKFIPIWSNLVDKGLIQNRDEMLRTLKHIFRSLWVYFAILDDRYEIEIKRQNLSILRAILERIRDSSPQFFPLLILFHDIGRPFDKESHALASANLLRKFNVLDAFHLDTIQKTVLEGVVKNHLLPGTIFTGESSYYSAVSLLTDDSLKLIWTSTDQTEFFFNALQAFTFIDIWGYDYAKVFDHYFVYYPLICETLSKAFKKFQTMEQRELARACFREFSKIDNSNFKWRISCALRIYQFINTQGYLSKEFFFEKVDSALAERNQSWLDFANSLSNEHSRLQFNYVLPIMVVLASGFFSREPIREETRVKQGIFKLWEKCAYLIRTFDTQKLRHQKESHSLVYFVFEIPRGWFLDSNRVKYILSEKFFSHLETGILEHNQNSYSVSIKIKISF